jgi:GNAT superfamily N-acetyltransferase
LSVETCVISVEGIMAGTEVLRPNQTDLGIHVGIGGFVVNPEYRGIGKAMVEHRPKVAKESRFSAMLFHFVVSTNETGVNLWVSLRFRVVGMLPKVFRHEQLGLVDAYVTYRFP